MSAITPPIAGSLKGGRPHWSYLHKAQMRVFRNRARFKCVVAGRRWGKTALSRTLMIAATRKSKQRIWYIAPTYQMARQIMWQELQDMIPRKWIAKINETTMTITLKNKSEISCKGADKPDTLRGVGLHLAVLDEFQDMRLETWTLVIQPTLASTRGKALIIGTPKSFNHLYDYYMRGQDPNEPDWESWQFKTSSSPFVLPEEIEAARRNMSEKEFAQEFEASFETMSNRVYHAFDRNLHVTRVKLDPRQPVFVGLDFNVDPMSAIFCQIIDGQIRVFGEKVLSNSHTQEMAEEMDRLFWRLKKRLTIYPDASGKARSSQRGESNFQILRDAGFKRLKYRRKQPPVSDRINAVNRMLRSADGTVRVQIDHGCRELIASLEQTQYKIGTSEVDKSGGNEHEADAFGYFVELEFPVRGVHVMGVSI